MRPPLVQVLVTQRLVRWLAYEQASRDAARPRRIRGEHDAHCAPRLNDGDLRGYFFGDAFAALSPHETLPDAVQVEDLYDPEGPQQWPPPRPVVEDAEQHAEYCHR